MSFTSDAIVEYMKSIVATVNPNEMVIDDDDEQYQLDIMAELEEREKQEETLWAAEDDELEKALDEMEDDGYTPESAVLIAYMNKVYDWEPKCGIEKDRELFPHLYND